METSTKDRLMAAVERSAALAAEGASPNQAIAKAAAEKGVRPGDIHILVTTFNIGRTNRQLVDGKTLQEKIADFPLADTSGVLEILYPSQTKTAALEQRSTAISAEYAVSPRGMLRRREMAENVATWHKQAAERQPPPPRISQDPTRAMRDATHQVQRLQQETETFRRKVAALREKMAATFQKLTNYFRNPDALPMQVVKENLITLHGDVGSQVVDSLVNVTPSLTKLARHTLGASVIGPAGHTSLDRFRRLPAEGEPYRLTSQLIKEGRDFHEACNQYDALYARNEKKAADLLRPFAPTCPSKSIGNGEPFQKVAITGGFMSSLGQVALLNQLMGTVAKGIEAPSDSSVLKKNLESLTDPEHEAKLRGIHTSAMLQDYILNDPILRGYDPSQVTDAFNEITQVAPHTTDQKMIMRTLLQKRLQQGTLDPFDADQLLNIEDKLRKRELPTQLLQSTGGGDGSF